MTLSHSTATFLLECLLLLCLIDVLHGRVPGSSDPAYKLWPLDQHTKRPPAVTAGAIATVVFKTFPVTKNKPTELAKVKTLATCAKSPSGTLPKRCHAVTRSTLTATSFGSGFAQMFQRRSLSVLDADFSSQLSLLSLNLEGGSAGTRHLVTRR